MYRAYDEILSAALNKKNDKIEANDLAILERQNRPENQSLESNRLSLKMLMF